MSTAPTKRSPLPAVAQEVEERNPGWRTEIVQGRLVVTPLRNGPHAEVVVAVMLACVAAGLHSDSSKVLPGIGVRLPEGPEDYAVPDLSVVTADYREHLVRRNRYAPGCFRLTVHVTSSVVLRELNCTADACAEAEIPVCVVVDLEHQHLHVLTDPAGDAYANHRVHAPGEIVTLPDSIGAKVTLNVDELLKAGRPHPN